MKGDMWSEDDLDIGPSGGEFSPYLKYNAKENWWGYHGDETEKELREPRFAIDLRNIQTGWLRYDEGAAPDRVVDPAPGIRASRPSDRHKRGFIVRVFGRTDFTGAAEFSHNAVGVCSAIRELHRAWRAEELGHPGEVPIVAVVGTDSFKSRYGVNYSPKFKITAWIKRPAELPDEPVIAVDGIDGEAVVKMRRRTNPGNPEQIDTGDDAEQPDDLNDNIPF
jgi:hypothetical protein